MPLCRAPWLGAEPFVWLFLNVCSLRYIFMPNFRCFIITGKPFVLFKCTSSWNTSSRGFNLSNKAILSNFAHSSARTKLAYFCVYVFLSDYWHYVYLGLGPSFDCFCIQVFIFLIDNTSTFPQVLGSKVNWHIFGGNIVTMVFYETFKCQGPSSDKMIHCTSILVKSME